MEAVKEWLLSKRESRRLVLVIVSIALLLDNMLLTTVVPIIPKFLYQLRHPDTIFPGDIIEEPSTTTTAGPPSLGLSSGEPPPHPSFNPNDRENGRFYGNVDGGMPEEDSSAWEMGRDEDEGGGGGRIVSSSDTDVCVCPVAPVCSPGDAPRPEDLDKLPDDKRVRHRQKRFKSGAAPLVPVETEPPKVQNHSYMNHEDLLNENLEVGIMFSSKAVIQLITNPFIGPLTHRIGYSIPMFAGFVIMFLSTLIFAFGNSFWVLFLARSLQGIGSSCSSVSGMGMLAERYPDDKERGNAMGIALGGLALGVLIGPPFGGIMYQFVGKSVPFLILAILALGDGLLQLVVLQPSVVRHEEKGPTLRELVNDPYIIISAGAITFANMGIGMLEPSLPLWMMDTMGSEDWQLGVAFLPASISYLVGTNLFGPLGHFMGRWLASLIGLIIIGICLMCIPLATNINHLIAPNAGLGLAIGMVDSSMMPELGYLVDIRHSAVYGSVYSIGDVAFCLGFAIGPVLSGTLVKHVGFQWMLYGIAFINFLYAPLMYCLRAPPATREESKCLMKGEKSSVKYVNYKNDEEE